MYDKTVRRRRMVLAALVALSLILVTAYFGEPGGGPLHSVQRGFLTVISPIQDGANKALKPVRDAFNSVHDAFGAENRAKKLQAQVSQLRKQVIDEEVDKRLVAEASKLLDLDTEPALNIKQYGPVTAQVDGSSPTLWYSTVNINAGTSSGIALGDPVIDGDGVVGKITLAASDSAQVQLITDQASGVAAQIAGTDNQGIIQPKVGDPSNLVLGFLPSSATPLPGQQVVTAGSVSKQTPSLFPPDLPIGQITSVNVEDVPETVNVRPYADVRQLDVVQVLTRGTRGVPNTVAIADARSFPAAGSEPPNGLSGLETASTGSGSKAASGAGG